MLCDPTNMKCCRWSCLGTSRLSAFCSNIPDFQRSRSTDGPGLERVEDHGLLTSTLCHQRQVFPQLVGEYQLEHHATTEVKRCLGQWDHRYKGDPGGFVQLTHTTRRNLRP